MNRRSTYFLALIASFILIFSAQSILLATHTQANLLQKIPYWMAAFLAILFYFGGVSAATSVLLAYPDRAFWTVQNVVGLMLGTLSILYLYDGHRAETILLGILTISFILSSRVNAGERDWLVLDLILVNTIIGVLMIWKPELLNPPFEINKNELATSVAFGISFLISSIIGLITLFKPETSDKTRLLAIPWAAWGAFYIYPFELTTIIIVLSILVSLSFYGFIPWNKLVISEGKSLARRFIHLTLTSQSVSFGLIAWMLYMLDTHTTDLNRQITVMREIALASFNVTALLTAMVVASVSLSINGIFLGLSGQERPVRQKPTSLFWQILEAMMQPFNISYELLAPQIQRKQEIEHLLSDKIAIEKRRSDQLGLLRYLNQELETNYEPGISARLACNAIQSTLGGAIAAVFQFEPESDELVALAVAGPYTHTIPAGYKQSIRKGVLGRALRSQKTQLIPDTRLDPDYFHLEDQAFFSEIAVPLLFQSRPRGVLIVANEPVNAFDESDVRTLETVALRLVTSWHRSAHDRHLTELVEAGAGLISGMDPEAAIRSVADIAQRILDARFTFVALTSQGGMSYTRYASAGYAPKLLEYLKVGPQNNLVRQAMESTNILRMNDARKQFSSLPLDGPTLRGMLAVPIQMRHTPIGCLLVFGKIKATVFDEDDEALLSLLATQAGAAIESSRLYQDMRAMLNHATKLYDLSTRIIQAEKLTDAAAAIAEASYQEGKTEAAGIILLSPKGREIDVRVEIDQNGLKPGTHHPMDLIWQCLETGQVIFLSDEANTGHYCIPLQTLRRQYGVLWLKLSLQQWESAGLGDNLHTLANQSAIALERSILLTETRAQADTLEVVNRQLEEAYDQTLRSLTTALDARDRETEGHSRRVTMISTRIGLRMGMSAKEAQVFERGALLHDIGKIGISDLILLKPGKLNDDEWQTMRQHPDIGARIVEGIPFLQESLPVIRYHHEKWDGTGYPIGLKGAEIPLMARIFSIVDNFDALTSIRPYREKISYLEAIEYLKEKAGSFFDPAIVALFEKMYHNGDFNDIVR
jgi:GAF domain-containing protein